MARTELWNRANQRSLPLWLPIAVAALIAARIISSHFPVRAEADLVVWVPAAQAEEVASMRHLPLLYEFSADWCGPCRVMEEEIFHDAAMARLINERFVPVRLVDRQRETGTNPPEVLRLQMLYHVNAFPTVVIARRDAEPATMVGYRGRDAFDEFLRASR